MPNLCELEVSCLECPACGGATSVPGGVIGFQWGKVPHRYQPGDPVAWLRDTRGDVVPAFRVLEVRRLGGLLGTRHPWNYGEPNFLDLFALDVDPHLTEYRCERCAAEFERIAARVQGGRFTGAVAFLPGVLSKGLGQPLEDVDVVLVNPDGTWWTPPEWKDPELAPYGEERSSP